MQNNQTIKVIVVVDVDRASEAYSRMAVQALDPTRKGPTKGVEATATLIDKDISKAIALSAVQSLLNGLLNSAEYGETTVRIQSPKNFNQIVDEAIEAVVGLEE